MNNTYFFTDEEIATITTALNNYIDLCTSVRKKPVYKYNKQISDNISLAKETIEVFASYSDIVHIKHLKITACSLSALKQSINELLKANDLDNSTVTENKNLRSKINQAVKKLKSLFEEYGEDFDY